MEEADKLCTHIGIMNRGKLAAVGTPAELKAALSKENVTLEDVFTHYTSGTLDSNENFRETSMTRRTARRLA